MAAHAQTVKEVLRIPPSWRTGPQRCVDGRTLAMRSEILRSTQARNERGEILRATQASQSAEGDQARSAA